MPDQTTSPSPPPPVSPDYAAVERAAARIAGVAHRTPVMTSRTADERLGSTLFFKCENFQRGGAFKFRGAYNAIASLPEDQRRRGAVAFSSGNHAQAMALAGRLLGAPVTIVMPHDAPAAKVAATRGYGAEVVVYDRYKEDREAIGRRLAEERGSGPDPTLRPCRRHRGPGHGREGADRGGGPARPAARLPRRRWPAWPARRCAAEALSPGCDRRRGRARGRQRRAALVPVGRDRAYRGPADDRRRRPDAAPRPAHLPDPPAARSATW